MTTYRCFWRGWKVAAALWPVVAVTYLVDGCLAAALAFPPANHLAQLFGHSTMAPNLLGPVTLDLLLETTDGLQGIPLPWSLYLLMPLLFLVVGTFLRGGILGAMARDPETFRGRAFASDCARFFGRLLLLLLLFIPGLMAVGLIVLFAGLLLALSISSEAGLAGAGALLAFLLFLLPIALDYARISLVLEPERSVLRHAGRALRFLGNRFPQVVLLGLGFTLAGALIAVAYPALLQLSPLFGAFLPSLVAQQLVALLASWQRVATLGGNMALYGTRRADAGRGRKS